MNKKILCILASLMPFTLAPTPVMADNILSGIPDKTPGMFVAITGSGSAMPDPERAGASVAVVIDGTTLQFDFGRNVMENEMLVGINPADVDYVFLTHHHFDHIAELGYYVMATWLAGRHKTVPIYGPTGTQTMLNGLYAMHELDVGFIRQIAATWPKGAPGGLAAQAPFAAHDEGAGVILKTDKFTVRSVLTPHLPNGRSMAYRVDSRYGSVVISGDTGYSADVVRLSEGADLLIHEMQLSEPGTVTGGKFDTELEPGSAAENASLNHAHSTPTVVGRVASEAKVKKLVVTHLAPFLSVAKAREMSRIYNGDAAGPEIWTGAIRKIAASYSGPIIIGEDRQIFRIGN